MITMSEIDASLGLLLHGRSQALKIQDLAFPEQDRFVTDTNRYIAALCTRRAGKTTALALRFIRTMKEYPGCMCRYIALTRDSAKDIMWGVLHEVSERFELDAHFTESNLTMTLQNGSKLRLFGADMKNFINRLKGAKSPGVAIDEAQDFGTHITQLVDDVLTPTLADFPNSWIALTGTPGPIPAGLFFDITEKENAGYSVHKWSLYQNPYMPDPKKFVEDLRRKKAWDENHPTFLREYRGIWTLDQEALFIRYNEKINHYDSLPNGKYEYILGVDLGIRDADALALLAWSDRSPVIYLVEEKITTGQDITALTEQINGFLKRYEISKIIVDEGALGKKIAEEIRRRKGIPVQPADKARKIENAAFLNDWLRQGHFKARRDSRFAKDSRLIQIDYDKSTSDRLILKKGYHSDIIDSVLYAFKESPAFAYEPPPARPKHGTPEWAKEEETEMERAALEHAIAAEEADKGFGEWNW